MIRVPRFERFPARFRANLPLAACIPLVAAALTLSVKIAAQAPGACATAAPSTYSAYTGTDAKPIPPAPALGPANSVIVDPTFGSKILRVTDSSTTADAESFISTDAGFHRAWNANSTAIKLTGPHGDSDWLEFNPSAFAVGDGSSHPVPHPLSINSLWEWSAVNPQIIYFLNGDTLGAYKTSTGAVTNLGGPANGDPVTSYAVVVGLDNWVCSAAGAGVQDTYTEIFCVNPSNPSVSKFIDVVHKTINGVSQSDPNWPTSAAGETIGIHSISGGTGPSWLNVTFHQASWSPNGDSVLNLGTNTWSKVTNADIYWSGHPSLGNGSYVNGAGSQDGRDSRGLLKRDPDNLMNAGAYRFFMQPTPVNWYDAEHSSWFNSMCNANAPVLDSRYTIQNPSPWLPWIGEIVAAATDGSNTVWRFAHNHNGALTGAYYSEAFAQISYDGNWALFSSPWDGTLGTSATGLFDAPTRIDTFIVRLSAGGVTPPTVAITAPAAGSMLAGTVTITASATDTAGIAGVQFNVDGQPLGPVISSAPFAAGWVTTAGADGLHVLTATARDTAGLSATSSPVTVTVNNTVPLSATQIAASNVTATTATITWTTNALATSQVDYGTTAAYGMSSTLNGTLVTTHGQTLTSLAAGTTYHYRVDSRNALGALLSSADYTFTTASGGTGSLPTSPVQWTNVVNATVSGVTLTKTGGCGGCDDAGAISKQQITSGTGYLEFTVAEPNALRFVGLSTANFGTISSYIRFAFRLQSGVAEIREKGVYKAETPIVTGDRLRVAVGGGQVTYLKNGSLVYTSTAKPLYPVEATVALYDLGATVTSAVLAGPGIMPTPTTAPVAWTSLVNLTLNQTTLTKTSGCDGCEDAGANSAQQIVAGDGYVEFTASETGTIRAIGLSNGNPGTAIATILFALKMTASATMEVHEAGVYRSEAPYAPGDVFRIAVVGGQVKYSRNGTVFYTSATPPVYPLLVDTSFLSLGSTITKAVLSGSLK